MINRCIFKVRFLRRFLFDFGSILEALGGHLGGLGKRFGDALGPVSPSSLQRGSQIRFGRVLVPFWTDFGGILETFWWPLGSNGEKNERNLALKTKS